MSRDLNASLLAASLSASINPIMLVRVGSASGDMRMWTGYGPLEWGGYTWLGGGTLLGISPVQETGDVQADGIALSLSGVPSEMISLALGDARQGLPAEVYIGALDDEGALLGDPYLLFSGLTDVPSIDDTGEDVRISITAENRLIDLERPRVRRYTPEDQKAEYPNDKGFDFVAGLQDKQITWGQVF